MPSKPPHTPNPTILKAEYTACSYSSKIFHHSLPASTTTSLAEKSAYLSALRQAVVRLQEDVNSFLTARMEDDKVSASMGGGRVDEGKEEENYGEEMEEG